MCWVRQRTRLKKTVILRTHSIYFNSGTLKGIQRLDLEVILFPCSTQLSKKFIQLINVEMPTIAGILTVISMINTASERLKARNYFICRYFSFYELLKFRAQLS